MISKKMIFLVFMFILFGKTGLTQNQKIDSLLQVLKTDISEENRAITNLSLAKLYERIDLSKGKQFALQALTFTKNDSLSAETNNQLGRFNFFGSKLDSASFHFKKAISILEILKDERRVAIINISLGAIQLRQGNYNATIKILTESASFFEKSKDSLNAAKCYSNIASAFAEQEIFPKSIEYSEKAIDIFRDLNQVQFELITLPNLAAQYYKSGDTLTAISYNEKAEKLALKLNNKRSLSIIYNNLGDIYLNKNLDKAKGYLEKTITLKNELNLQSGIEFTQSNLGYIELQNKNYKKAILYFTKASQKVQGKQLVSVYNNLKDSYTGIGNINKALVFSEKARILNDSILNTVNQKEFVEIQTKYETGKKEKEILSLQNVNLEMNIQRRQNRNLLIGTISLLCLTMIIGYLLLKNSKRKQTIAEQQQILEIQKADRLLKDQELIGLDAMLEGQEKERQRISEDLHDNLGSKLSTIKLYMDEVKANDSEILKKISILLDETYDEVRNIAHEKQSSTQIDKGLIPAVKLMANRINGSKKLDIKVVNIDFNYQISTSKELQLFRIIQELLSNTIKHAKAKQAIIQFSEDNNQLNFVYEDDGLGFDKNSKKEGIGLSNIERRIRKINGSLSIDSIPGNGTTVIVNVPI
ncbi:tetratricopeptide repeat protein [Dokdonia sp.]|uniref:tetratricopeptide repeat-containing sensor histidine kinase n=1 Tax=Dokdonia sp. TaxID=2024995 RepID=UPI003264BBC4